MPNNSELRAYRAAMRDMAKEYAHLYVGKYHNQSDVLFAL